jgi:hypothetical protein
MDERVVRLFTLPLPALAHFWLVEIGYGLVAVFFSLSGGAKSIGTRGTRCRCLGARCALEDGDIDLESWDVAYEGAARLQPEGGRVLFARPLSTSGCHA